MNVFEHQFKGKKILVTGHTGIIGSWLSLWLTKIGAKVVGFSNEVYKESLFELGNMSELLEHIEGDINDFDKIKQVILENKPEIIIHLAAQPLVIKSYEIPIETFQTNVIGTANVLQVIREAHVRNAIIMTSDKCYENKETDYAYKETDPLGGHDPYSASKGAAELITASFRNSFFSSEKVPEYKTDISSVRSGNIIGGGDWAEDRIVPDCIRSLVNKKTIRIRNPQSIRPWQFVLEPISGIFSLLTKMIQEPGKYSSAWNFGPSLNNKKVTVKELVEKVIQNWGEGNWENVQKKDENHEANLLILDATKAITSLGWKPVFSTDDAVSKTISWYKAHSENKDIREFSLRQIEEYEQKAKEKNLEWAKEVN